MIVFRQRLWQRGYICASQIVCITTLLCLGIALTQAQQQEQQQKNNTAPATASNSSGLGNVTNVTTSAQQHGQNANVTMSLGMNGTTPSSNQTNVTASQASPTPSTYPLASFPATGALLGTGQAPFPAFGGGGAGGRNGAALGPDDNYIAAAVALLPNALFSSSFLLTFALIIFAGAVML